LGTTVPHDIKGQKWFDTVKAMRGNWNNNPNHCCSLLYKYLGGSVKNAPNIKIRIVQNYLTSPGFRTGRIKSPCVLKLRSELSAEIKIKKMKGIWIKN
jgi:hypothetical protein